MSHTVLDEDLGSLLSARPPDGFAQKAAWAAVATGPRVVMRKPRGGGGGTGVQTATRPEVPASDTVSRNGLPKSPSAPGANLVACLRPEDAPWHECVCVCVTLLSPTRPPNESRSVRLHNP